MTDIVARLCEMVARGHYVWNPGNAPQDLLSEAAAEIERLRAENERLSAQLMAWSRALGKRRRTP
jgi:hypothetical protein